MLTLVCFEYKLANEYKEEWSAQIADALNIAGCWMADCPREEDSCHHSLHLIRFENHDLRLCPQHINLNLLKIPFLEIWQLDLGSSYLILVVLIQKILNGFIWKVSKIILYYLKILISFSGKHFIAKFLINRNVIQQKFPCFTPLLRKSIRNTIPGDIS